MSIKQLVIFCDYCSTKVVTDGTDVKLKEIKTASVPGGSPFYNAEKKIVQNKENIKRPRMFKCPNCGRGVTARQYLVVESKHEEEKKENPLAEENQHDGREASSDGHPFSG